MQFNFPKKEISNIKYQIDNHVEVKSKRGLEGKGE